jgi:hypothetical protein
MNWSRLVTIVAGAGIFVAGLLIPGAGTVLLPTGTAVIGWAIQHPADAPKK